MKILLCPDKFKGSFSAKKVCLALRQGLLSSKSDLQITMHPMADGGDGSLDILKEQIDLKSVQVEATDPLGKNISAAYYRTGDTAYIELASASGLVLLKPEERNPLKTSTYGTGLMIKDAIDNGLKKIYLFIGGSATNDAGVGIAHALGFKFLNEDGIVLKPTGENLRRIHTIDFLSPFDYSEIEITVLCDVINPMYGPQGAAQVYAAQKGATKNGIELLDQGLIHFAKILNSITGHDVSSSDGMGAAGAVSASLVALMNAKLRNGFDMISTATDLEFAIANVDLVITGEGKIDGTSVHGKVVGNVATLCKKYNVPCGLVSGIKDETSIDLSEFRFAHAINSIAEDLHASMSYPEKYLIELGKGIANGL